MAVTNFTGKYRYVTGGCALGDATRDLQRAFPGSAVTGYDISDVAISEGRRLFPGLDLVAGDLLMEDRQFDVIFSSNTLEHFHDPHTVLKRLAAHAREYVWLLVPFQDPGGIDEHFVRFDYTNIPDHLADDSDRLSSRMWTFPTGPRRVVWPSGAAGLCATVGACAHRPAGLRGIGASLSGGLRLSEFRTRDEPPCRNDLCGSSTH